MMPSPPIHRCTAARRSDRLSPGNGPACAGPQVWPANPVEQTAIRSFTPALTPALKPSRPHRRSRLNLSSTLADAKSP